MFGGLGMGEMILIFLVVLLLFGAKRLPEIGQGLGKGIREFKRATTGTPDAPSPGALEDERRSALEPREVPSRDSTDDSPRRLIS